MRDHRRAVLQADVEHQPVAVDAQMQRVGPAVVADRRERCSARADRRSRPRARARRPRLERPIDASSSVTATRRCLSQPALFSPGSSPVEADRDRARVGVEPFGLAERDRRGPERAQLLGPAFEQRGALHEIEHAEARREARRARGRQHVVGAGDVIADRFRRVRAEEDRAGIADFGRRALRRRRRRSRDARARARSTSAIASSSFGDQDDGAEVAPRRAGDRPRAAAS